ncbi:MAG: response regulator [Kiritimatiellae bacterium]|nr:response regulator [Kiritimatiellia bacterium]
MAKFLLIDDDQDHLDVMTHVLHAYFPQHRVVTAKNGPDGLHLAESGGPDVIFLDVELPGMDGFELCRRLKAEEKTAHIPVVMATGRRVDPSHRFRGLELGADGYLFKPYEADDLAGYAKVMLRIKESDDRLRAQKRSLERAFRNQTVELKRNKDALQRKVHELEATLRRQTQKLIHTDRLASAGILSAGIAHEINNPNTFISSNLETFGLFWTCIENALDPDHRLTAKEKRQLTFIRREMPALLEGLKKGTERIADIVRDMKSYTSTAPQRKRLVSLAATVQSALQLAASHLKSRVRVRNEVPADLPRVRGSEQMLCQVFVNLFLNAANAIREAGRQGTLTVRGFVNPDGHVVVQVKDNGPGIRAADLEHLFDPFWTTRRAMGGSGLGLFVSHGIIEGHNGSLDVESEPGKGAAFTVEIPAAEMRTEKTKAGTG